MEGIVGELKTCFYMGRSRSMNWRKKQLQAIYDITVEHESAIAQALYSDMGKSHCEAYRDEIGCVKKSAKNALESLHRWMAPAKVSLPLATFRASGAVMAEPLGVVLIFSTWNFPFGLAMEPMIGAIAAGNALVLKPSELAPATADLLAKLVAEYLDNTAVRVVMGGPQESAQLLEYRWDKIFFTGSPRIGRIVMSAAAKYLTPVTLELGGKCPTIVDSLRDRKDLSVTSRRIASGKWAAANGQACLAVDYILVEEDYASTLINALKKRIEIFYGEDPSKSNDFSRIVNNHQFKRLTNYLQDPSISKSIVYGGRYDEKSLYIQPTILLNPPSSSDIMNEEIFGPLLPVITLKRISDSIEFINERPKPLAVYLFTNNTTLRQRLVSETSSGSFTVNDTIIQYAVDTLPFGGVGDSGFGRYHGKYSFETFSHEKAVLCRELFPDISFRYPPWSGYKLSMLKQMLSFNYLGLLLVKLGLKK